MSIYQNRIRKDWYNLLKDVFEDPYLMPDIFSQIKKQSGKTIRNLYPTKIEEIFRCFNTLDPEDLKAVILCGEPNVKKHFTGIGYEFNSELGSTEVADEIIYELNRSQVKLDKQLYRKYAVLTKVTSDYHQAKARADAFKNNSSIVPFVYEADTEQVDKSYLEQEEKNLMLITARQVEKAGLKHWHLLNDPNKQDYHPVLTWKYQGVLCINVSLTWLEDYNYVNPNENVLWDIWKPFMLKVLEKLRVFYPQIVFGSFDPFIYSDKDYKSFLSSTKFHVISTYLAESDFFHEVNRQIEEQIYGYPEAMIDWNLTKFS